MLQALGKKYNTDKSHPSHSFQGKTYCDTYDRYFRDIRHEVKCVVEIGVLGGSSIKMWEEYFPNAVIYGIDIDDRAKVYESERIKIIIGDQNDADFLLKIKNEIGNIDILIDDGSHINRHIIHTYSVLKDNVKKFYIVEDLACSYESNNLHDIRKLWQGQDLNDENDDLKNYRHEIVDWFTKEIELIDGKDTKWNAIHFHNWIMMFEKL